MTKRLIRQAGRVALEIHDRDYEIVMKKDDAGPVTEADFALDRIIVKKLMETFPGDTIVCEESGMSCGSSGGSSGRRGKSGASHRIWWIDPIDGTKEFIRKNGEWCVMIGLTIRGRPRLGLIYEPIQDRLYYGIPGQGAFVQKGGGRPRRIRVNEIRSLSEATGLGSRSHPNPNIEEFMKKSGMKHYLPVGSMGLKLAQIAEGRADVYLNFSRFTYFWDLCAGDAILQAAGGVLLTFQGKRIHYFLEPLKVPEPIASFTRLLRKPILNLLRHGAPFYT